MPAEIHRYNLIAFCKSGQLFTPVAGTTGPTMNKYQRWAGLILAAVLALH